MPSGTLSSPRPSSANRRASQRTWRPSGETCRAQPRHGARRQHSLDPAGGAGGQGNRSLRRHPRRHLRFRRQRLTRRRRRSVNRVERPLFGPEQALGADPARVPLPARRRGDPPCAGGAGGGTRHRRRCHRGFAVTGGNVSGAMLGAEAATTIESQLTFRDSWERSGAANYVDPNTHTLVSPGARAAGGALHRHDGRQNRRPRAQGWREHLGRGHRQHRARDEPVAPHGRSDAAARHDHEGLCHLQPLRRTPLLGRLGDGPERARQGQEDHPRSHRTPRRRPRRPRQERRQDGKERDGDIPAQRRFLAITAGHGISAACFSRTGPPTGKSSVDLGI